MSYRLSDRCECGHRYPEHSLFGTCRACAECDDGDPAPADGELAPDHAYRQCPCRAFRSTAAPGADGPDGSDPDWGDTAGG